MFASRSKQPLPTRAGLLPRNVARSGRGPGGKSELLLVATLGSAITGAGVWYFRPTVTVLVIARFGFTLGTGQQFSNTGRSLVAISPDGTHIVYVANRQLYLRSIDQLEARPITGSGAQGEPNSPAF
jgi:hypothetical protein